MNTIDSNFPLSARNSASQSPEKDNDSGKGACSEGNVLTKKGMRSLDSFFDRELSWLAFNERVLANAEGKKRPLLERARFLSISCTNLDEFFMVRIAGLQHYLQNEQLNDARKKQRMRAKLKEVLDSSCTLMRKQQECWKKLRPELDEEGYQVIDAKDMKEKERKWVRDLFVSEILPVLTPIKPDTGTQPMLFLPNLALVLILELVNEETQDKVHIFLPLPQKIERFLCLPKDKGKAKLRFIALEDVICEFIKELYPSLSYCAHGAFRIIRDSDIEMEEEADDLVKMAETIVRKRRMGKIVLLKVDDRTPDHLYTVFAKLLLEDDAVVHRTNGFLGLSKVQELVAYAARGDVFKTYNARYPERIKEFDGDCFNAIKDKDILIHHPYEQFSVVVDFLEQAADDPNVIGIKQTLYRTSYQSPIVAALIRAAEKGKNVTAIIELQARFDEQANLRLAKKMAKVGVNLVYGKPGYKVHGKLSLVMRREGEHIRRYVHVGTGNYHPITANIYTDLSLFTCNAHITDDAAKVFHYVTGDAEPQGFSTLRVAPIDLRESIEELIDVEITHAKKGRPAAIWMKANSISDKGIINKLYQASNAGVQIELIIRGVCCLRPGLPGMSENIRVKSIIGRFLEHSRIYCFGNGYSMPHEKARVFIASADLMPRNLKRRVEIMCPVLNKTVHRQVLEQIMVANVNDTKNSWVCNPDGTYTQYDDLPSEAKRNRKTFDAHDYFMTNPSLSGRGLALRRFAPKNLSLPSDE